MAEALFLEQVEQDIELLGTEEDPGRVLAVMSRLAAFGEPAVVPLLNALQDTKQRSILRQRGVGMFPQFLEDARAMQVMIGLLHDADVRVRWAAVKSLEDMRAEAAIAELEALAAHDEGEFYPMPNFRINVREDAAKAVEQIRSGTEPQYKRIEKLKAERRQERANLEPPQPAVSQGTGN